MYDHSTMNTVEFNIYLRKRDSMMRWLNIWRNRVRQYGIRSEGQFNAAKSVMYQMLAWGMYHCIKQFTLRDASHTADFRSESDAIQFVLCAENISDPEDIITPDDPIPLVISPDAAEF